MRQHLNPSKSKPIVSSNEMFPCPTIHCTYLPAGLLLGGLLVHPAVWPQYLKAFRLDRPRSPKSGLLGPLLGPCANLTL